MHGGTLEVMQQQLFNTHDCEKCCSKHLNTKAQTNHNFTFEKSPLWIVNCASNTFQFQEVVVLNNDLPLYVKRTLQFVELCCRQFKGNEWSCKSFLWVEVCGMSYSQRRVGSQVKLILWLCVPSMNVLKWADMLCIADILVSGEHYKPL